MMWWCRLCIWWRRGRHELSLLHALEELIRILLKIQDRGEEFLPGTEPHCGTLALQEPISEVDPKGTPEAD